MRLVLTFILLQFAILSSNAVVAFELFGVALNNIDRVKLRAAIRDSGAEVVREAGDDNWYDVYDMKANFKQSKQLFVAYEKTSGSFAFAEYHLPFSYFKTMLIRLKAKYGKPKMKFGMFESDASFFWTVDGIDIELQQNWHKDISRLVYSQKDNLTLVQQAYRQTEEEKRSKLLQLDGSYF